MPEDNVELVRSIFAAWERGDFTSAVWAHPEIEVTIADGPEPGHWAGSRGLIEGGRVILNAWDDWRVETDEVRELDVERVLTFGHLGGRGKTSGVDLARMRTTGACVMRIQDGKVTETTFYWDHKHALDDLGLTE